MAWGAYDVSVLSWSPDAVEPQFGLPSLMRTIKLAASTTYPKGSVLGEITATPGTFGIYAHANSDGTQKITAILPRAYVTDSTGAIFEGAQASGELAGVSLFTVPAFIQGAFKQSDLSGFDTTNGLADMPAGSHVLEGSIANANAVIRLG